MSNKKGHKIIKLVWLSAQFCSIKYRTRNFITGRVKCSVHLSCSKIKSLPGLKGQVQRGQKHLTLSC